ncbi:MAG: hypothetical protein IKV03_00395 [Alphaproteobacteria bacterium]|nr:hypothetical protein [Alphaproteobacteria bacterium]
MDAWIDVLKLSIQGPEFWMSVAFFAIILGAFFPLKKFLNGWGKRQAAEVQAKLDEPANLRKEAEALLTKYENHTKNQDQEYVDIMKQAKSEIDFLQKDFDERLKERLVRKDKETEARLQMIRDNGVKEIENQMLKMVVKRTYDMLTQHHKTSKNASKEMDRALENVCETLKQNMHLVRK